MCQCTQFGTLRDSRQSSQDWSRLGFVSALSRLRLGLVSTSSRLCLSYVSTMPHLRLDYTLASISCEHCRSSRNHPHCVPRHLIYYCQYGASVIRRRRRLVLHEIDNIKMAGTSLEISSVMTSAANNYNTRLDSSIRIKTRIHPEVT